MTNNDRIKSKITLLRNKIEEYYSEINMLLSENNNNLDIALSTQLGKTNMNYQIGDIDIIKRNTNRISKLILAVKSNLTEISLLADQLDPISLTEQDVDNLTLQIETVKNTPVNGDDI